MSIERERYEQMTRPAGWLERFRRLFVFPPLPRQEAPANPPAGGTSADRVRLHEDWTLPPLRRSPPIAHQAPVILAFMNRHDFEDMKGYPYSRRPVHRLAHDAAYQYRADGKPTGAVEVEIRLRRIVETPPEDRSE